MECPEALDVMGDALEGSLGGATLVAFEEHLGECLSCGSYFEQLQVTLQTLRSLPPGASSPRRVELLEAFREKIRRSSG